MLDWLELLRLIWRGACLLAKVINVVRAAAWLFDHWDNDDKS